MANITFHGSYSMIDPPLIYNPVTTTANSSTITVRSSLYSGGTATDIYRGSFSYTTTSVYGTVNSYSLYDNGSLLISASGSFDANTLYRYFGDPMGAYRTLGAGNDTINGTAGTQVVSGFQGNDSINLGAGIDTVFFRYSKSNYSIEKISETAISVRDNTGYDGTDTLYNVEFLKFGSDAIVEVSSLFPVVQSQNVVGNNYFTNSSANETFTASASKFKLSVGGVKDNYSLTKINETSWAISGSDIGTDTLVDLKRVEFTDTVLALDVGVGETAGQAYRLYQAAFARTPDMPGVKYHMNDMESNGLSLKQIATNFMASPEFQSTYGDNISDDAYINALYQNVLGRGASSDEVAYYQERFDNGTWDRPQVMINFAESPENVSLVGSEIENGIWLPL